MPVIAAAGALSRVMPAALANPRKSWPATKLPVMATVALASVGAVRVGDGHARVDRDRGAGPGCRSGRRARWSTTGGLVWRGDRHDEGAAMNVLTPPLAVPPLSVTVTVIVAVPAALATGV